MFALYKWKNNYCVNCFVHRIDYFVGNYKNIKYPYCYDKKKDSHNLFAYLFILVKITQSRKKAS